MRLESKKLLKDVLDAIDLLVQFSAGKTFADYERDPMLRAAVEREFEIVGEARQQFRAKDPETANAIPEHRRIVAFRNVLIHGYAQLENRLVWEALTSRLDPVRSAVRGLLESPRGD